MTEEKKEDKFNKELLAISQDIGILSDLLINTSMSFYQAKANLEGGSFNPIDWTAIIVAAYMSAMFKELGNMGALIEVNDNSKKYLQKVEKFHKFVARHSKEMTDLRDCFPVKKTH